MNNDVFFDYAVSRDITIENAEGYKLGLEDWNEFITFVEEEFDGGERGLPYKPISSDLMDVLEHP